MLSKIQGYIWIVVFIFHTTNAFMKLRLNRVQIMENLEIDNKFDLYLYFLCIFLTILMVWIIQIIYKIDWFMYFKFIWSKLEMFTIPGVNNGDKSRVTYILLSHLKDIKSINLSKQIKYIYHAINQFWIKIWFIAH